MLSIFSEVHQAQFLTLAQDIERLSGTDLLPDPPTDNIVCHLIQAETRFDRIVTKPLPRPARAVLY